MPRIRLDDGETLRRLSVGEAACLQSFPRWYAFHEEVISEGQAYIGIGNAVQPVLGRHLSRLAREHLEKAREIYREAAKALLDEENKDELTTNSTTTAEILDDNHSGSIKADGDNKDKTGKSRGKRVSFDSSVPEQAPVRQPQSAEKRDARAARRAERWLA